MDQKTVAEQLQQIATLLELHGENPFKVRAFANGARVVETLPDWHDWQSAKGIGKGLAVEVEALLNTGQSPLLEELLAQTPSGWLEVLQLPGLGPKKVHALAGAIPDLSVDQLATACQEGRVAALAGFGDKTQSKILESIHKWRQNKDRLLLPDADLMAQTLLQERRAQGVKWVAIAGEVRRRLETVGKVKVAEGKSPGELALRLFYETGSPAHVAAVEAHAQAKGFSLTPDGLRQAGKPIELVSEQDLYRTLGLPYVPPERRETGDLPTEPEQLVDEKDLVGLFHCHTTWSDGRHSLEEMAEAARKLGYRYLGISDHSQSAHYAGGLKPDQVKRQWEAIDALNVRWTDFQLLKGIESDILEDGSLDYDDDLLAGFDFVIASVHNRFGLKREAMTQRIVTALAHPKTRFLGHMTGRLLLARAPYDLDKEEVFEAAARHGVVIEINASPKRLDIDWRDIPQAASHGVLFAISPDAHHVDQLRYPSYGVAMARKAGLTNDQVINTRPWADIRRLYTL